MGAYVVRLGVDVPRVSRFQKSGHNRFEGPKIPYKNVDTRWHVEHREKGRHEEESRLGGASFLGQRMCVPFFKRDTG